MAAYVSHCCRSCWLMSARCAYLVKYHIRVVVPTITFLTNINQWCCLFCLQCCCHRLTVWQHMCPTVGILVVFSMRGAHVYWSIISAVVMLGFHECMTGSQFGSIWAPRSSCLLYAGGHVYSNISIISVLCHISVVSYHSIISVLYHISVYGRVPRMYDKVTVWRHMCPTGVPCPLYAGCACLLKYHQCCCMPNCSCCCGVCRALVLSNINQCCCLIGL